MTPPYEQSIQPLAFLGVRTLWKMLLRSAKGVGVFESCWKSLRMRCLTAEKSCSMGFRSGLYAGKKNNQSAVRLAEPRDEVIVGVMIRCVV